MVALFSDHVGRASVARTTYLAPTAPGDTERYAPAEVRQLCSGIAGCECVSRRPVSCSMAFTVDSARLYIADVRWQFAKTMPQWPHEYTVREWRPELQQEFEALVALIRSDGVIKPWPRDSGTPRYHHSYLELDGWEYWSMGAPIPETTVINRALFKQAPGTRDV